MTTFTITRISDGVEVYRYSADSKIVWNEFPETAYAYAQVADPPPPPAPTVYGGRRIITQFEFLQLFTQAERIAIRAAAASNGAIYDYLDLLAKAQQVNLDDGPTVTGVNTLESAGLLAAGRAAVILNG